MYRLHCFSQSGVVTSEFDDHGAFSNLQNGWAWYAGI